MLAGVPTILITGAAGRIGTMLRPRLARPGRTLRLLDIADLTAGPAEEVVQASITDLDAMTAACRGAAAVIHLAAIATEAPWEEILQLNIQGTYVAFGAAGGRAAGDLRLVQPRGRVRAAGELPGARLRVPRAGHLLRRGQGGGRGPGRPVPLPVRPGHDLHPGPDLLRQAPQRPGPVHLAVPGRRRTAVRGLPERARPGVPGRLRRLGEHPRWLGQPAGGEGARLQPPGRRGGVRGRGDRGVRRARPGRPGVPLPRRRVHPARPGRQDPLSREAVREYATALAGEIAALPEADAIELEACCFPTVSGARGRGGRTRPRAGRRAMRYATRPSPGSPRGSAR